MFHMKHFKGCKNAIFILTMNRILNIRETASNSSNKVKKDYVNLFYIVCNF